MYSNFRMNHARSLFNCNYVMLLMIYPTIWARYMRDQKMGPMNLNTYLE